MKNTTLFLLILLLSGCANWAGYKEHQTQKYVGKPLDEMYAEYGAPKNIAPLRNGGHFIEFRNTLGEFECSANVKTNSKEIITEITNVGGQNGCIAGKY